MDKLVSSTVYQINLSILDLIFFYLALFSIGVNSGLVVSLFNCGLYLNIDITLETDTRLITLDTAQIPSIFVPVPQRLQEIIYPQLWEF